MESGEYRFIPAGAGNTQKVPVVPDERPVYPRWRGEHGSGRGKHIRGVGLSPLARGTLFIVNAKFSATRFIPAGAGNTPIHQQQYRPATVYPRWRGEHRCVRLIQCVSGGLSPLARGTLSVSVSVSVSVVTRFIPAGAGNTLPSVLTIIRNAVYPRWRGEHTSFSLNDNPQRGLSPLARGTRKIAMSWLRPLAVYPRWRGEHSRREPGGLNNGGLSPLARGTPISHSLPHLHFRFIPAGAGNTRG